MTRKVTRKKFRWAKFGSSTNTTTDKDVKLQAKTKNITPKKKSTFNDYIKKLNTGAKKEADKIVVNKVNRKQIQATTRSGHNKWEATKEDLKNERVRTTETITEWVPITDPGMSKGGKGRRHKQVTKTISTNPYYIDEFTGGKIRIDKSGRTSTAIEFDHRVPANRLEKAGILTDETLHDKSNIIITTADANRRDKGASGLHQFVPPRAKAYAQGYDKFLTKIGGLMTESEAAAVWKHTGKAPTSTIMKNPAAPTFEDLATQQARHDRMRGIQRNR